MELLIMQLSPAYYFSPLWVEIFSSEPFSKTFGCFWHKQNYTFMLNAWERITANSSLPSLSLVSRHGYGFVLQSSFMLVSLADSAPKMTFVMLNIICYNTKFSDSHSEHERYGKVSILYIYTL
jgi:hypothetical protein